MSDTRPLLLDSITDAGDGAAGRIAVSGSHGGLYPATLAAAAGLRGVVFNDAGIGLEHAGVAGVEALAGLGLAAAAADCRSCLIGSAVDTMAHGVVSVANAGATRLGIVPGMRVDEAVRRLGAAPMPAGPPPPMEEARREVSLGATTLLLLDSASLARPGDAGRVIVTGSHGGLIGGDPARALKAAARIAVFNDAGIGKDGIGISRLPALEARGIAAVTVGHDSAQIGDAASALATGRISALNPAAEALGARPGQRLASWLEGLHP